MPASECGGDDFLFVSFPFFLQCGVCVLGNTDSGDSGAQAAGAPDFDELRTTVVTARADVACTAEHIARVRHTAAKRTQR